MKELTIKSVISTDKKKDGTSLVGKFGPYWMVKIDTVEEGWISMFAKGPSTLKAGDKITGNLEVSEKNGFTNKNFSFPKDSDVQTERIAKLEGRVTKLELSIERLIDEKIAKVKSDLVLDMTGKFQTDADYKEYSKPHPLLANSSNPLDGIPMDDEIPFD